MKKKFLLFYPLILTSSQGEKEPNFTRAPKLKPGTLFPASSKLPLPTTATPALAVLRYASVDRRALRR
jgi:hypothetical protein